MKLPFPRLRQQTPVLDPGSAQRRSRRHRLLAGLAALGAGLALALVPLRARADSARIYLFNAQGAPVEVTSSYLYQVHYVYDLQGNLVGSVDAQNVIYDASDHQIGYITLSTSAQLN